MNPSSKEEKALAKSKPAWIKRVLLVLLFASAVTGFVFGILTIRRSTAGLSEFLSKEPAIETKFNEMQAFFEKAAPDRPASGTIQCQGVILSETHGARAVIDGQAAEAGAVVNGARILEITVSNVLVEYKGKTRRLAPGEGFFSKKP